MKSAAQVGKHELSRTAATKARRDTSDVDQTPVRATARITTTFKTVARGTRAFASSSQLPLMGIQVKTGRVPETMIVYHGSTNMPTERLCVRHLSVCADDLADCFHPSTRFLLWSRLVAIETAFESVVTTTAIRLGAASSAAGLDSIADM